MSQSYEFKTRQKKKTLKRRIPILHGKDIPHPKETPKEKNFDTKRKTPIHVIHHSLKKPDQHDQNEPSKPIPTPILQNSEQGSQSLTPIPLLKHLYSHPITKSFTQKKKQKNLDQ